MNYVPIKRDCNMEFLSNKIICSQVKPNEKSFLLGIPMYMYRVQSHSFVNELNFFQDLVLRLKRQPGTSDVDIQRMTGLDTRLVQRITKELITMHLLTDFGGITQQGTNLLDDKDTFIISNDSQQVGYVFQYATQSGFFPYYVPQIVEAESPDEDYSRIYINAEDDSLVERLYKLSMNRYIVDGHAPNDIEVCHLIENTRHNQSDVSEGSSVDDISRRLSIKYIPNNDPVPVWVCVYVYLPLLSVENNIYSTDWKVTNPFGSGDCEELELYLKHLDNDGLKKQIMNQFKDADTDMSRKYEEVNNMLETETDTEINYMFGDSLSRLSDQMRVRVRETVSCYIRLQHNDTFDYEGTFYIRMQKAIEEILAEDQSSRFDSYYRLDSSQMTPDTLRSQFSFLLNQWQHRQRFSNIKVLQNAAKGAIQRDSMLRSFAALVLTRSYDTTSRIYTVFQSHVQFLINLRYLRNENGHGGQTYHVLSVEERDSEKLYNSFIQIIKTYISIQ